MLQGIDGNLTSKQLRSMVLKRFTDVNRHADHRLCRAQERCKHYHDIKALAGPTIVVGDNVFVQLLPGYALS